MDDRPYFRGPADDAQTFTPLSPLMQLTAMLLTLGVEVVRFLRLCPRLCPTLAAEHLFGRQQLALDQERNINPRRAAFTAMRPGTVLVNVARGEIIDEEALIRALAVGKLRGVGLDVYEGEF